jgi:hypothetical protein
VYVLRQNCRAAGWRRDGHKILLDRMSTDKDPDLLALQEKESGAWLHALPSTNLGTLLDNQCFRISTCLRVGIPMCSPPMYMRLNCL